jgi:ribosomal protein S18 acetylase RimI-like enzyme
MIKLIEQQEDLKAAIELVNEVFQKFVAVDYSQEGQQTFYDYLEHKDEELARDLEIGHKKMWGYYEEGQIVGVISVCDLYHISLLFVSEEFQKRGIAKKLYKNVVEFLTESQQSRRFEITVNSSPYAVEIYKKLGFVQSGEEQEKNGIRFTPLTVVIN